MPDPYMFRLFRDEMGSCETIICKNYKILRGSLYYKAGVLLISTFYILLDTGEEIFAHCSPNYVNIRWSPSIFNEFNIQYPLYILFNACQSSSSFKDDTLHI